MKKLEPMVKLSGGVKLKTGAVPDSAVSSTLASAAASAAASTGLVDVVAGEGDVSLCTSA